MSSVESMYAIRLLPGVPDQRGCQLESIELSRSVDGVCTALNCKPTDLRALSHEHFVWIGLARSQGPAALGACPVHSILMRGPTLMLPLEPNRENIQGAGLDDVEKFNEPATQTALEMVESVLSFGDENGGNELRRWTPGEPFPSLNAPASNFGPASLLVGKLGSERFTLDKMLWNDIPEGHQHILDVPGYVAHESGVFPTPAAIALSTLSFYTQLLAVAHKRNNLPEDHVIACYEQIKRLANVLGEEIKQLDVAEWPVTSELWSPKS